MAATYQTEPYKISAGALALLVHFIFFSMLYFSFSWQMKPPQGMVVDIWDALPSDVNVMQPPQEQPEEQVPEKVQPLVKPRVDEGPSALEKAEIEVQQKKTRLKEEKKALENAAAKKLAEKKAEQAERRLEVIERQASEKARAQSKAQQEAALAAGKVVDEYVARIQSRIRRFIVLPPGVSPNIKAEFKVTLLPSGDVLSATLTKSSGNEAYDNFVERAILKASPLPLPPVEQNMFNRFRDLRLKFTPAESGH